jgi:signal transduction histidine kinase/CheY-like chemotaxis protein
MDLNQDDILKIAQIVPGIISIYKVVGVSLEPLYFSEDAATLSGLSINEYKEYIGQDASSIIIPEDKEFVVKSLYTVINDGKTKDCVYRIYNKQSKYIWIHATAHKIGTFEGAPLLLATFVNTTVETEVQTTLLNHTTNSVYVIDAETYEMLYANEVALNRWGKTNYTGQQCYKFISNLTEQCPWCILRQLTGNFFHIDETYVPAKNKWFKTDCELISWYARKAYAIYSTDITQIKKDQLILEKSNQSLQATINNIPVGICVYKKKNNKITCIATNPYLACTKGIVNCTPGKEIDNSFFSKIYPGESEICKRNFMRIFESGHNIFDYRTLNGHSSDKDGMITPSYIWLHIEGYAQEQKDGSQLAYVCYTNITQEKESEQEANRLRRIEEEHYAHTIDGLIAALPKAIGSAHLDLTQNFYSNFHTTSKSKDIPIENGSVDYLINYLANRIYDEETKINFLRKFNRTTLISSYKYGQNFVSFDYQHKDQFNGVEWETMSISLARNPKNEDLEAVLYAVNSEDKVTLQQINKHLLSEDYDNVAIINTINGSINFISMNDSPTTPHNYSKYNDDIKDAFPRVIPKEELDAAIQMLSLDNIIHELESRDCFVYSFSVIAPDNKRYRKQTRYSYLDKTKQKILLTRTDITDATKLETEQKDKLEKALEAAEKANEMKSSFLSTVSHDMRTPLNGIIGYTTLALQQNDPTTTHDYLEKIKTASDSLLLLINDTLDLARIENGNEILKPEVVQVMDYISSIITTVKPSMDAKHINFKTQVSNAGSMLLKFDKMRMEKILLNLLSNAAKFTPDYGTITFIIKCLKLTEKTVTVRVTVGDTGCGMSKSFIPKAFEPFTQERTATTANIGGSGLGLSIVKRLVEMMGGQIEVESEQGKGTIFTLYLTLEIISDKQNNISPSTKIQDTASLFGKHILLCEDNAVNREIAIALLESKGLVVDIAVNGKEGVEKFNSSAPGTYDLILMDIRMPIMNGYDATEEIRRLNRSDATIIPIIAMTADAYDDDVKHALTVGMNAHIAKPIDAQKLFDVIKSNL